MPRDNERITELLADAERYMRQLVSDLNQAGAPWQLLRSVIDMGGNLGQGLGEMDEGYYDDRRCSSGGYSPRVMRPIHIPDETAKRIAVLHKTLEAGIEQILKDGVDRAIASDASEEETLIEPPQNE